MSDKLTKINWLCVAGFVCSLVVLIPCIDGVDPRGSYSFFLKHYDSHTLLTWPITIVVVLAIVGLILSLIGIVSSRRKGNFGKAFAIVGIVISLLIVINFVAFFFDVLGVRSNPESPPTLAPKAVQSDTGKFY